MPAITPLHVERRTLPAPRATVLMVHGLGDHIGLYGHVLDHLAGAGFEAWGFDLRGHGRSGGRRGHVTAWRDYVEDFEAVLGQVQAHAPGPVFLMGNSMGALLMLDRALAGQPAAGVVALSPPFGRIGIPPWLIPVARLVSRVWPTLTLNPRFDLSGISRQPDILDQLAADPWFHRKTTARLGSEILRVVGEVRQRAPMFPVPLLLLHGGADRMVGPEGSRALAARLPPHRSRYVEYPGAYHSLLHDINQQDVLEDITAWMAGRTPRPA